MTRPRITGTIIAAFTITGWVLASSDVPPPLDQADYPVRQEVVPDFGIFVPADLVFENQPVASTLERVTTAVPWGRGMVLIDDSLVILSRGRHRGEGGLDPSLNDHAGTLWSVDPSLSEVVVPGRMAGDAVQNNAEVFVRPTAPPFHLYDFEGTPTDDALMCRPYCALEFDQESGNLFVCAYSGAEFPGGFRKHATDGVFRFDLRSRQWHVVEQHDPASVPREALGTVIANNYYPHHVPGLNAPPHGWVNGPDGCTVAGDFLYVSAKDNHIVAQYDLSEIRRDPHAGPPSSAPVLGTQVLLKHPNGMTPVEILGPSSVIADAQWLYVGFRTSSIVIRLRLDERGDIRRRDDGQVEAELIGVFEPWDAARGRSGNLYDIDLGPDGALYVSMGREGKIWRIMPDPARPFFGNDTTDRAPAGPAFVDMTSLLGRRSGCNNIFVDDEGGWLYISTRNNDAGSGRVHGTIYRVRLPESVASAD